MHHFQFQTTKSVLCESGATARIGTLMADMACTNIAFVTDKQILALGLADAALASLKTAGITVHIIDTIVADPPENIILEAVEQAKTKAIDGVVALGGGSSLDTAKLVAVLACSNQPLAELYGIDQVKGTRLPLLLAPTTAGTGSEVTPISIVTTGMNEKKGVVAPQLLPDWAVLDAQLTINLPPAVTAATGIDAMVHAIEAFTSKHKKNILSDTLAQQALTLLGANIHKACTDGHNIAARSNMLLGSMLAGMAFANAPVAAVHALAYPLGGHFHVPHGLSNALVLPHVLAFNAPHAALLYAQIAPLIFNNLKPLPAKQAASAMVEEFKRLGPALGMQHRLRDVGVHQDDLPMLATDAMKQTRLLINNPREVNYQDALDIYSKAF